MKKFIFIVILFLFSTSKNAQEDQKNIIKINALLLISNIYEINYERILNDRSSLQIGFGAGKTTNSNLNDFQELYSDFFGTTLNNPMDTQHRKETFSLNIGYRHYTKDHKAPKGFYIGPTIQYINFKERLYALEQDPDFTSYNEKIFVERLNQRNLKLFNVQALLGYQFFLGKIFYINPYAGPSWVFGNTDEAFQSEDENVTGFGLNFGIGIGFGF